MLWHQLHRSLFYIISFTCIVVFIYDVTTNKRLSDIINRLTGGHMMPLKSWPTPKENVTLVVGILSRLDALERRMSLRHTWLKTCNENNEQMICRIFTDHFNEKTEPIYLGEKRKFNDLVHMPFRGINFALRLIWMFDYYTSRYSFDFFLRVDDDYFLCVDRLLNELSHRPKQGLYWGWVHCGVVRVDEGFMILTHDIVEETLGKLNTTLMCSKYGDHTVPLWIQESKLNITWFADNDRVIHEAPGHELQAYESPDLCKSYLAIHRSYPKYMYRYWLWAEKFKSGIKYTVPDIPELRNRCPHGTQFIYNNIDQEYRDVLIPCKDRPHVVEGGPFWGRKET